MHIGFDISQTGAGRAGCGFFAHAMIGELLRAAPEHRYSLYPSFGDAYFDPLMPLSNPYRGRDVRYGPRHLTRASASRFWNAPRLGEALGEPDVVHANNFWCPTQLSRSRIVYTCYDLGFLVEPGWTTEANRIGCFEGVFRSSVAADWVVAISEATRAHYLATFPHFPQERVRVIYPASRFAAEEMQGTRPRALTQVRPGAFWLCVGTLEPRKNQWRLVQAYARHAAGRADPMPLVFAGGKGWLMDDFTRRVAELGVQRHVIFTGYVGDDELAWLYRHCYANLYPSLFEGFGLPLLEGMQFGAASVASDAASLPEVAGGAALTLPPEDVGAWADALTRLAGDNGERMRLAAAARERAKRFDRAASARALLDLYETARRSGKRTEQPMTTTA